MDGNKEFIALCGLIISQIDKIDKETPTSATPPSWWLEMQKVRRAALDGATAIGARETVINFGRTPESIASDKNLMIWNGRAWGGRNCSCHIYAAAKSKAELLRMLDAITGRFAFGGGMSHEVDNYWHKGAWGTAVREAGLYPTKAGVWVRDDKTGEIVQLVGVSDDKARTPYAIEE